MSGEAIDQVLYKYTLDGRMALHRNHEAVIVSEKTGMINFEIHNLWTSA